MRRGETPRFAKGVLFSNQDLRRLIVPLLLEQLLAVLIGMADTVMVASCGEASVSGVALVDSVNVLLIQMFTALATGGAVVASQYLGKKDQENAGIAAAHLFYVVLLISLPVMTLCLVFRDPLLSMLFGSIERDVMTAAQSYMLLSALSFPFLAVYNASAALLRAEGNARDTLYVSIAMNLANVAGNAITIFGFGMGVTGAGLATLISRALGAIVVQPCLRRPGQALRIPRLIGLKWQSGMAGKILSVGIPNGLENSAFQLGKLLLIRMVATFGTVSIAANAVTSSVATFQCLPGNACSLAMITVVGQCVGAGDYEQTRWFTRRLMTLTYAMMSTLNIVILLAVPLVVKLYALSPETEQLAKILITIHGSAAVLLWPMSFTFPNALRAAGDARFTMIVSSISMLVFRMAFAYLLAIPLGLGVIAVWTAMIIDWCCRITCFVIRWRSGKWQTKALV